MTIPTPAELTLLRTYPQAAKMWLSIYQPPIVFEATINDNSISKGARIITLGTTLSGSLEAVQPNYTMLVGTTRGNDDIGKIRIRYVDGNTIVVAENSDVEWLDGYYLTVLMFVEINPVYPRIIQDPNDAEKVIFYKDYDIEYTDQNNNLGVFMNMGCHTALFLDDSNSAYLYYTASGTYSVGGDAMGYDWWFAGADGTTGSTSFVPGLIHYTQPGHYMTRLLVSGTATASSDIGYRFISVYDRPENGVNTPFLNWEMLEMSGNRDDGGYNAKIRVRDSVSKSVVRDGALVVIFADEWFGGNNEQAIGGNAIQRSNVFMTGWIVHDTITYNYRDGYVEFEIASSTVLMQTSESFAVSLESKTSATTWYELKEMDCRRAIYHYLRWHSTVLSLCDFEFRGTDQLIQFFDSDRQSIYDSVATLLQTALRGELVSDRQGKLFAEITVAATDQAATAFPVALSIDKHDWIGDPVLDERIEKEVSYLEIGGVAYDGPAAGNNLPFICAAPGLVPSTRGKVQRDQGLALLSQPQLNILAGNLFAYANSRWPNIDYQMGGMFPNLDIAPQELIQITMGATDTPRGVTFTNKPFTLRSVQWSYNPRMETLLPSISVAEVTQGVIGEAVIIPVDPPADDGGGSNPPPPPGGGGGTTPPPPPPPFTGGPGTAFAFGIDNRSGTARWVMARTTNLTSTNPTWNPLIPFDGSISGITGSWIGFDHDPFDYGNSGLLLTTTGLWRLTGLSATPSATFIVNNTTVHTLIGSPASHFGASTYFRMVKYNPIERDLIGLYVDGADQYNRFLTTRNYGSTWVASPAIVYNSSAGFVDPFDWGKSTGRTVFVGGSGGTVAYSNDYGQTFIQSSAMGGFYGTESITTPYGYDDVAYAVASNVYQSVHKTDDGAQTIVNSSPNGQATRIRPAPPWWNVQIKRNEQAKLAIFLPSLGETYPVNLFKSVDGGATWSTTYQFAVGQTPYGLIMHPYNDGIYYAHSIGLPYYFMASFNGGTIWVNKTGNWSTKFLSSPNGGAAGDSGTNQMMYPVFKK